MLKNIQKYIPKRKYRERSQNERRKKWGFLEKKQDYKVRAEDFHKKEEKYKKLKEAARTRNPDEFYYKMIKAKIIDGEHVQFTEGKDVQDKVVSNTQFINLVNFKKSQWENEKKKMLVDLQLNAKEVMKGNSKHIWFFDNEDDVINDSAFVNWVSESLGKEVAVNKEKISKYKQKAKHVEKWTAISKGLIEQKELVQPGKRMKEKEGHYRYFSQRKK